MRFKLFPAATVLFVLFFSTAVFADYIKNSKLLPTNKIIVLEDGKKVAEYSKEMPVPEGLLLSCVGKCAAKLENISFVADDQSRFSINTKGKTTYLGVEHGVVYFGVSSMPGSIVFMTPKGAVSANQLIMNASMDNPILEGYIKVTENSSEVGVIDGGSMQLLTNDGQILLSPGDHFILAQADIGQEIADATPTTETVTNGALGNLTTGQRAFGATVGIAGGAALGGAIFHDSRREASPFRP